MIVKLNIEEDEELRVYIKQCIKGQVLSIVRDEFLEIVREELSRKIAGTMNQNFDFIFKQSLEKCIKDILSTQYGVNSFNINFIKPYVEAKLEAALASRDWSKIIDDLAKEKVRNMIN